jgi:signal transduction histidine kinase
MVLTIDDDGPGLQPADIERVLQPGQRLDETAPGFGFGLSITRELVELYGGTLDFARASLGGLRAVVMLPRTDVG